MYIRENPFFIVLTDLTKVQLVVFSLLLFASSGATRSLAATSTSSLIRYVRKRFRDSRCAVKLPALRRSSKGWPRARCRGDLPAPKVAAIASA